MNYGLSRYETKQINIELHNLLYHSAANRQTSSAGLNINYPLTVSKYIHVYTLHMCTERDERESLHNRMRMRNFEGFTSLKIFFFL